MKSEIEVLSFLDLLDLDEELIDARLSSLMSKSELSEKHLKSVSYLLKYKALINLQDNGECANDDEYNFVVKLLGEVSVDNIDDLCNILNLVLSLNPTTLICKAEHLLYQILASIQIPTDYKATDLSYDLNEETHDMKTLQKLKICNSILDSVINVNGKVSLQFLELPIEKIIFSPDEKTRSFFLTCSVPKLFEAVIGYNILDKLWDTISGDTCRELALKVLISLSNYYIPIADGNMVKYKSSLTHQHEFWRLVIFGLESNVQSLMKFSIYLAKRAVDYLLTSKSNVIVKSEKITYINYELKHGDNFRKMWENYFILIESLEEKQSNIVLPSLLLFEVLYQMGDFWLNCAFNLGITHDNAQVRIKCLEYRLMKPIINAAEARVILEALNDFNYYDNEKECKNLNERVAVALTEVNNLNSILKAIPFINWSPVPLYNITMVLSNCHVPAISAKNNAAVLTETVINILKVPCNNVPLRIAICSNISRFVARNCNVLGWKDLLGIFRYLNFDKISVESNERNPLVKKIKSDLKLDSQEMCTFLNALIDKNNIDFALIYLDGHPELLTSYIDNINIILSDIEHIINRQYSNKIEVFKEVEFITHLFSKAQRKVSVSKEQIISLISRHANNITKYIIELMSNETNLNDDEIKSIFVKFDEIVLVATVDLKDVLLILHKTAMTLLQDPYTKPNQMVLGIFAQRTLIHSNVFKNNYKHERININNIFAIHENFHKSVASAIEGNGRLRNSFYEKLCEVLYKLVTENKNEGKGKIKELVDFIENMTDYGGYGCLIWILRLLNYNLSDVIDSDVNLNIPKFMDRLWTEIEELKTNKQYSPCMEEFINVIINLALMKKSVFNNTISFYCRSIIDYGILKNTPLYYLCRKINELTIDQENGLIVYIFSQILQFSPVPKKDQRVADNFSLEVLQDPHIGIDSQFIEYRFNYEIQWLAISTFTKIKDPEVFKSLLTLITSKTDELFQTKARYHGNSQTHRQLLFALQNLLFMSLLNPSSTKHGSKWCLELLGKFPHQPSVRLCLEWYITLHVRHSNIKLDKKLLRDFNSKKVPVTSQFMILYWAVNSNTNVDEIEFVMDTLLSHTMGQMFNVRLTAQYLATKLYNNLSDELTKNKYKYTIYIIEKTFEGNFSDKVFVKLQEDYFSNLFDVKRNLTPSFIYYFIPKYFDITHNEQMDLNIIRNAVKDFESNLEENRMHFEEVFNFNFVNNHGLVKKTENSEKSGPIQKKYIPWNSMTDIDVYDLSTKKQSPSELIVVASLIDKLPNLGGMARTGEVFGIKTYVIDSLRHLQDKQFQGLSVSAERWVDIKEVRPGGPLKEYLLAKKNEGYSVVAAEQTSTSSKLQNFKFPKKTLLLLGHEKDGIPCDLLPMMDYCVEIPQQGYVRSLNVHVTAAIFVWEYSRQNILKENVHKICN